MTTTPEAKTIVIARTHGGDLHAHLAGCSDLRKRNRYQSDDGYPWTVSATSVDDVTFEAWGASGVASDDCDAAWDSPEYRAYTLANYDGQVRCFPCAGLR